MAHKLLLFHVLLLGLLSELLVLAVDIPAEEGGVAALAFIEFAHVQGVLKRFLIESIGWVIEFLVVLKHVVLLELFQRVLAKSALEYAHGSELLSDLWHRVGTVEVLLAARALHEVEGDALGAPSMAQKLSDAARMEDVAAVELHAGLLAEGVAADLAIVELGSLIARSALDLEAGKVLVLRLSFATGAGVSAVKLVVAGSDLGEGFQFGYAAALGVHHREELGILLSVN